jgi:hypothetical protein
MRTASSYLEIHVHGVDGHVAAFVHEGAETIRKLIGQIHAERLFTPPYLAVAGRHSLSVFPTRAVVRVDLVMEGYPDWPFHYRIADALELTEEEFRQRLSHALHASTQPGVLIPVWAEIELTNGERIYLELRLHGEPQTPIDFGMLLQQFLSAPSQHARRLGGGVLVINPAHILRLQFHPRPPVVPPGAWSGDPLAG